MGLDVLNVLYATWIGRVVWENGASEACNLEAIGFGRLDEACLALWDRFLGFGWTGKCCKSMDGYWRVMKGKCDMGMD
jgi:hypothetical protein